MHKILLTSLLTFLTLSAFCADDLASLEKEAAKELRENKTENAIEKLQKITDTADFPLKNRINAGEQLEHQYRKLKKEKEAAKTAELLFQLREKLLANPNVPVTDKIPFMRKQASALSQKEQAEKAIQVLMIAIDSKEVKPDVRAEFCLSAVHYSYRGRLPLAKTNALLEKAEKIPGVSGHWQNRIRQTKLYYRDFD